jgi:hypothetical protein
MRHNPAKYAKMLNDSANDDGFSGWISDHIALVAEAVENDRSAIKHVEHAISKIPDKGLRMHVLESFRGMMLGAEEDEAKRKAKEKRKPASPDEAMKEAQVHADALIAASLKGYLAVLEELGRNPNFKIGVDNMNELDKLYASQLPSGFR